MSLSVNESDIEFVKSELGEESMFYRVPFDKSDLFVSSQVTIQFSYRGVPEAFYLNTCPTTYTEDDAIKWLDSLGLKHPSKFSPDHKAHVFDCYSGFVKKNNNNIINHTHTHTPFNHYSKLDFSQ